MRAGRADESLPREPRRIFAARMVDPRRARQSGGCPGHSSRGDVLSILTVALFGTNECTDLAARVRAHEPQWTRRSVNEFFTLGAASYLDDPPVYLERASATNPLLEDVFSDL